MRRVAWTLLPAMLLALVCALPANAGNTTTPSLHYRWKDAAGVVHFGDTIPASALAGGYDIVNNEGQVVRHVPRQLTPAQRKAAALAAARAADARRAQQQQTLEDAQLLSAYPTAKALQQAQRAQLQQIHFDIAALQQNLLSQETSLTELLSRAADLEHAHKPVPLAFTRRIAEQRQTVNGERGALAQRRGDLANAQSRFARQLQRYQHLRTQYRTASDPPASS